MANRYWVGGTGTWNSTSTANWSATSGGAAGASVPTSADSVFFDQAGTYSVTLSAALNCLNFTVSAGTVSFIHGSTPSISIFGSLSFISGTVWSTTAVMTFAGTAAGNTITTNGTVIAGNITFNNASGVWTLGSALSLSVTSTTTLTQGNLDLAGFTLTTGIFSSNNAAVRTITFGTGNIVLTTTTVNGTAINMADGSNFSCTGTGGFVTDCAVAKIYSLGSQLGDVVNNPPNLTFTGTGSSTITLSSGSWFNLVDFGTTNAVCTSSNVNIKSLILSTGGTYTSITATMVGSGTIKSNVKILGQLVVSHTGVTTLLDAAYITNGYVTLTSGNLNLNGFTLTTLRFFSSNANVRSIAFNNANIAITGGGGGVTVIDLANLINFSWTGPGTFTLNPDSSKTISVGSTSGATATNVPNLLIVGAGTTLFVTTTNSWFNLIDFGTSALTFGGATVRYNNVITSINGTYTAFNPIMAGPGTVETKGKSLAGIRISHVVATTTTLVDALTLVGAMTLTSGELALAGFQLTSLSFASTGSLPRSITSSIETVYTVTASTTTAWSNALAAGLSFSGITISMTGASAKTFAGGGASYPGLIQGGAGALTISGNNTFADLSNTVRPCSIFFANGSNNTFTSFSLSGIPGSLVTVRSVSTTQHTLTKAGGGVVSVSYCNISYSIATPATTWYAGTTSVNSGNNVGWIFTDPPLVGYSDFFMFF